MLINNNQFDQFFVRKLVCQLRKGLENKEIFEISDLENLSIFYTLKPEWSIAIKHLAIQTIYPLTSNPQESIQLGELLRLLEASEKFLQLLEKD